jgi:hypothetical protein
MKASGVSAVSAGTRKQGVSKKIGCAFVVFINKDAHAIKTNVEEEMQPPCPNHASFWSK